MQLKLSALTAVLAAASSVIAAPAPPSGPSAKDVSYALDKITELSNNLDSKLKDTTGAISIGQAILSGDKDLITEKTKDISSFGLGGDGDRISGSSSYVDADQKTICSSFSKSADAQETLLKTIVGEKGILSSTFLAAPIAAVLRTDEGASDTLAFGIVGLVPSCANDVKPKAQSLQKAYANAVSTYASLGQ